MARKNKMELVKQGKASEARATLGRVREDGEALFPAAPPKSELPSGYGEALIELKQRIIETRFKTVLSANVAMVRFYWDIGRLIITGKPPALPG